MWVKSLFTNPWFSGLASICSIVSIALWFYREEAALNFRISPIPAIVVKAGQTTKLNMSYEGKPFTSDVTAIQVAVWNAGKKAIRRENILEPVIIKTENKSRILEATIRQTTRKVCDVSLDESRMNLGELGINWKILEANDGALIQIVYEGSPGLKFGAAGVIEGQGDASSSLKTSSPQELRQPSETATFFSRQLPSFFFLFLLLAAGILIRKEPIESAYAGSSPVTKRIGWLIHRGLLPIGLVFAVIYIWTIMEFFKRIPPFEF